MRVKANLVALPCEGVAREAASQSDAPIVGAACLRDLRAVVLDVGDGLVVRSHDRDMTRLVVMMVSIDGHHQVTQIGAILCIDGVRKRSPPPTRSFARQPIVLSIRE